jgi:amidase
MEQSRLSDRSGSHDVLAGPDDREAIAYRLALPPPRHNALKDFRVLMIDAVPPDLGLG